MTVDLYHVRAAPASAHAIPCTSTSTAPQSRRFSSYLLTVFSIDNGNERKTRSVVIDRESRGNGLDWVVDEPIGYRLIFNLKDANGAQGGYLPHIFEVVEFSCGTSISEQPDDSNTLRVDVGPSIPFYRPPLIHWINVIERDTLLTAVSDSEAKVTLRRGKWAVGSSILHFGKSQLYNTVRFARSAECEAEARPHIFTPSTPQTVLYRRSSDDGSLIIVVDVIALALLIIATVAIILCHVARRRRHRLAKVNDTITLQDVGAPSDLEAARETNANEASTEPASSSQKISFEDPSSGAVERALSASVAGVSSSQKLRRTIDRSQRFLRRFYRPLRKRYIQERRPVRPEPQNKLLLQQNGQIDREIPCVLLWGVLCGLSHRYEKRVIQKSVEIVCVYDED
ncbi:hypothetical protein BJ912DRAFT_924168 [Pholiota molesta]|nr:hypothetical protein BJ912DRAFT_924168 [Pholiota molesta]